MLKDLFTRFNNQAVVDTKTYHGDAPERNWSMEGPDNTQAIVNVTLLLRAVLEKSPKHKVELILAVDPRRQFIADMEEEFSFIKESIKSGNLHDIVIEGLTIQDVNRAEEIWRDVLLQPEDNSHSTFGRFEI